MIYLYQHVYVCFHVHDSIIYVNFEFIISFNHVDHFTNHYAINVNFMINDSLSVNDNGLNTSDHAHDCNRMLKFEISNIAMKCKYIII